MKFKKLWVDKYRQNERFDPEQETKIPREKIKLLYDLNFWDGPLSGVCRWEGKRYYFNCLYEETAILEDEPGDPEYVDSYGPVSPEWEWIFQYGYKSLADMDDLNENSHTFRYMVLFELTEEEWKAEDQRHAAWRKYIGRHSDYDENEISGIGSQVGSEQGGPCDWDSYNKVKAELPEFKREDILKRPMLGYFSLWEDHKISDMCQEYKKKFLSS